MHRRVAGSVAQPAGVTAPVPRVEAGDTIAAISTPVGEGAIAVVRVSGENAVAVADRIYRGKEKPSEFPSHTQRLGEIFEADRLIDQVMLSVHRAPASYTGEDLVEISCHGGILVTARVLETCLKAGARPARPGEIYRARIPERQDGSDPGRSGHGFDSRPERSRASLRERTIGRTARRRDQGASRATDRNARARGSRDRFSG